MNQTEFYALPEVVAQIEIQKRNHPDSEAARAEVRRLLAERKGQAFADKYMPVEA